jgi:hypothetical protein
LKEDGMAKKDRVRAYKPRMRIEGDVTQLKEANFNAQTWLDVRMFADICWFYRQQGMAVKTSVIIRECVERVHAAILEKIDEDERFTEADDAVQFLSEVGVSMTQFNRDDRARRSLAKTLTLEDRYIDYVGPGAFRKEVVGMTDSEFLDMGKKASEEFFKKQEGNESKPIHKENIEIMSVAKLSGVPDSEESPIERAKRAAEEDRIKKEQEKDFIASLSRKKV